jgi:hypothetical protein
MSAKIEALCAELSLPAVAHHYVNLADEAARKKTTFIAYLEQVFTAEAALRGERCREMMIRLATFPAIKTIDTFDFEAAPGAPKARIQELAGAGLHRAPRERDLPGSQWNRQDPPRHHARRARGRTRLQGALHHGCRAR